MTFQKMLVQGDRKIIYPILYFLLSQYPKHKKRAYLAQYLVSIEVPSPYLVDEEMNGVHQKYKELQAEFQSTIQHVDAQRKESASPKELQKKIAQLEQEKEQLVAKITVLKKKNANKPEFQELVESTSQLRKEQEEGSRLYEKQMEQKAQLDWYDQQLLMTKQRLIDVKKMAAQNTSPEKMLEMLKGDVKKNRELCNEILGRELGEKLKRLQQIEMILSEPPVTQSELEKLTQDVKKLQKDTSTLEEKAKKMTEGTADKLAIYKSQANAAAKKREKAQEEVTKYEEEVRALEKSLENKEKEYAKAKGTKFMKHDDFKQLAAGLRGKQTQYKKMREVIKEIEAELTILQNTERILRTRSDEIIVQMKAIEVQTGAIGFYGLDENLQQVSTKHEEINAGKSLTLDELTQKSMEFKKVIESRKAQLDPLLKSLNVLKEQYKTLEIKYNEQKQKYDATVLKLDNERAALTGETDKLGSEYIKDESKYHSLSIIAQITEISQARATNEVLYKTSADKRLSTQFKSYTDQLKQKIGELENLMKDAKVQQKQVRDSAELNSKQLAAFANLKKLLEIKLKTLSGAGMPNEGAGEKGAEEYNRLVL